MMDIRPTAAQAIALFVFVPFCKIKCTYCDFNAYANLARIMAPYADSVATEIRRSRTPSLAARSVYFGGGTPSLLAIELIEKLLQACADSFTLMPGAEVTLEANPGTVDLNKLSALRTVGVNRLSLGVQSFDEAMVKRLNRGHTVAQALETYRMARQAGFDNINLDLIYGLPLQSLDDWRKTLAHALDLETEHLSLYALKVEEGTGLEYQIDHGRYPMPDDDLAADMYALAEEMLNKAGYTHYEISNWAKGSTVPAIDERIPAFASRHNLTYWHDEPYLGFGAGAHSYFNRIRYWNELSPVAYIQKIQSGEEVVSGSEEISREIEMAETMILGLRLGEGVSFRRFEARFGISPSAIYASVLNDVAHLGLVDLTDDSVRLTARGRLLSNEVFWRLLP